MRLISALIGCSLLLGMAACTQTSTSQDYTDFVNPFIGTGGHGHTYPGAVVPNGMIQPSPDTRIYQWDACSGYYYYDSTINGFSHTHLSGTGCGDYGDVLLMPTVGKQDYQAMGSKSQQMAYASAFSHQNEMAQPGYYSVVLDRYNVKAELTATKRAAIHRYTFPQSDESGFILDLDYSLQRQKNEEMELEVISDTEICGRKKTVYWAFDQYINFYAKFSKPFTYTMVTDSMVLDEGGPLLPTAKVLLHFNTKAGEEVYVKVGISAVDIDGARKNVEAEIPEWDFNGVRKAARASWNDYLAKIDIDTDDKDQKTMFYTALYHTGVQPNLFTDVDGRYLGMDLKAHQGSVNEPMYTIFSLWDTYRNVHQLLTLVYPERQIDMVRTMLDMYREHGWLPKWELYGRETLTMEGDPSIPVIVDTWMKGLRDFDINLAYEAMYKSATLPGAENLMRPDNDDYMSKGYVPLREQYDNSVSHALEYYIADFALSRLAGALGKKEDAKLFYNRSLGYKHYYSKEFGTLRPILPDGTFYSPFNPKEGENFEPSPGFHEGNSWNYTFYVPHDVYGLARLMGGKKSFINKLQMIFDEGLYDPANEPDIAYPYLFSYFKGEEWRTQKETQRLLAKYFTTQPDGIPGNDDTGTMSAWAIFNMIGFYPDCPGLPEYTLTTPVFDKVTIRLDPKWYKERELVIESTRQKPDALYIHNVKIGGKKINRFRITHEELVHGGLLEFSIR